MKIDKVAKGIAGWINKSPKVQGALRKVNKNPAIFGAFVTFGLASILRPAAIGALPFKNDDDKKCSQASAISAGLIELASTVALFIPLNKCIEQASKSLYKSKGTFYEGNKLALRQFKSVTNRGAKMLFIIPMSLARFALIKPLLNNIFNKKEQKEKSESGKKVSKWA